MQAKLADNQWVATTRERLSSLRWFMMCRDRLLFIGLRSAMRANA